MKTLPLLLLVGLTALRLWAAATAEVTAPEAYHWLCAQRLDWAYFDGPGGTAALVHLGELLAGPGPLGVRFAFPLLAALASVAAYGLGRALAGPAAGLWTAVALNALPFFHAAAIHANAALPALALLLLAAWAFVRALDGRSGGWIAGGTFLLLAAQFHPAATLLIVGVFALCLATRRGRAELCRPGLYVALLLAAAGLVPQLLWNRANGWPLFALGTLQTAISPDWGAVPAAFAAAAAQLSIPALALLAFGLPAVLRAARHHARPRLALALAAPFGTLWLYALLQGAPAAAALAAATALLAPALASLATPRPALRRAAALALVATAAFNLFPLAPPPREPWTAVATTLGGVLERAQATRPDPLFVIAPDPASTAILGYHLRRTPIFLRESQDLSNQFGLWPRYDDFVEVEKAPDEFFQELQAANPYLGRSALYLTDEAPADLPQTITSAFGRVTPHATLELPGPRKMRVYLCEDYRTMPL